MKDLRESISRYYVDQLKELNELPELRRQELEEASKISAEQKHAIEDLNERLALSLQSCAEANEIVKSNGIALSLDKLVNEKLMNFHSVADKNNDVHLQEFVEGEFLNEQVKEAS